MSSKTTFYHILANSLLASVANNLIWFALTFWIYLETHSVLATSWVAGIFAVTNLFGGFIFGHIVDHERKKTALFHSSLMSLVAYIVGGFLYYNTPITTWQETFNPLLWLLIIILMAGMVANNLRTIALSTIVTMLFKEGKDKANGLVSMMYNISFALTSVFSGMLIGFFGMGTTIAVCIVMTTFTLLHLSFIKLEEPEIVHLETQKNKFSIRTTYVFVLAIPGLLGLIAFNTMNNFLGGVFMALMDAYGLSLVSVQSWGVMWAALSIVAIISSLYVSKVGVGKKPLRTIMLFNLAMWFSCIIFPLQASIYLLLAGVCCWFILSPFVESAEQTVLQSIVPFERQGRVFGFAQSIESMATPFTTFLIGPLAELVFIPFMTNGSGVSLIGNWFGTGPDRGIALVFILAGVLGSIITIIAWQSRSYHKLQEHYHNNN